MLSRGGGVLWLSVFFVAVSCRPKAAVPTEPVSSNHTQAPLRDADFGDCRQETRSSDDSSAEVREVVEDEPGLCPEQPIPVSLVEQNLATTDLSAVVRIDSVSVEGMGGRPPRKKGYVRHRYQVTVLEMLGGIPMREVVFGEMAEADVQPRQIGTVLIVSLCRVTDPQLPENHFFSPDNGYVFQAPEACIQKALELKKRPKDSDSISVCSG